MFKFSDQEKDYYSQIRALTTDKNGNEVLVGLTLEETQMYMEYTRSFMDSNRDKENRKAYLELNEKHEKARLEVIGSEAYLRNENPSKH